MDLLMREEPGSTERAYPRYNLEKLSHRHYRLTMALAGFSPKDLSVRQQGRSLIIRGHVKDKGKERLWLHRGIATRAFERRFLVDSGVDIERAVFENGMLCLVIKQAEDDRLVPHFPGAERLSDGTENRLLYFC